MSQEQGSKDINQEEKNNKNYNPGGGVKTS